MFHRDFYESQEPGQVFFFSLNHQIITKLFFPHDTFSCRAKCKRSVKLHRNHVWPHEHVPGGRYGKTPPSRRQLALRHYCSYVGGCVFMLVCLLAGLCFWFVYRIAQIWIKTRKNGGTGRGRHHCISTNMVTNDWFL